MSKAELPLIGSPYRDTDEQTARVGGFSLVDGFIGDQGELLKRPGLKQGRSSTGIVQTAFWWSEKKLLVWTTTEGKLYFVANETDSPTEITGYVAGGLKAVFTASDVWLLVASGGNPQAWDGSAGSVTPKPVDVGVGISHVGFDSGYFVALQVNSQTVWYTDPVVSTAFPDWDTFFDAESVPDKAVALAVHWKEVTVLGEKTCDPWYMNPGTIGETDVVFQRIDQGMTEKGSNSPYSLMSVDNTWFWLDSERNLIRLEGRSPKILSAPVHRDFLKLTAVDDCEAFQLDRFVVLQFPKAGQTWVFDVKTGGWSRWGLWNSGLFMYDRYVGSGAVWVPAWSKWLVARRDVARFDCLDYEAYTDTGSTIRTEYRSNYIDLGTAARKRTASFMTRGRGTYQLRFRDDRKSWGIEYSRVQDVQMYRLGMFCRRQYEIIHAADEPFLISAVEVDTEVLR